MLILRTITYLHDTKKRFNAFTAQHFFTLKNCWLVNLFIIQTKL